MTNLPSDHPVEAVQGPPADPLASLHKMSRTAGLGSQEYVAVNATAVASVLLGLASILAVLLGTILLVVPIATIIVAGIAMRQINRSAGTQTGKGIALLGMVLALGCVGLFGGRELLHQRQVRGEQGEIVAKIEQLGKDLSQTNYDAAWELFGSRLKERVTKEQFVDVWTRVQASPLYGHISAMHSNGIVDVQIDRESGTTFARGVILVQLASGREDRREALFRKTEDQGWVIEDVQGFFAPPAPPQPQQHGP